MVYQSIEWQEIEESALNNDLLISIFAKDTRRTVYVTNGGRLMGIITLGNFRRHMLQGKVLVQKKFTYVLDHEEENARNVLLKNDKIFAVPVVDGEYHIIREYRKEYIEEGNAISNDIIFKFWRHFLPAAEERNLIITRFENALSRENAQEVMRKAAGRLNIVDEDDIIDMNEYIRNSDYQIIYDCMPEHFRIREIIYKICGLVYSVIRCPDTDEELSVFHDYLLHFESVGILKREAEYFETVINSEICVKQFDESSFRWREDKNCYEYLGNIKDVPEAFAMSCCLIKNPCILCGNCLIPVISTVFPIGERYGANYAFLLGARSADYDLAYNIIPRLQRNNVRTIVISNMGMEGVSLESFDAKKASIRAEAMKSAENRQIIMKEFCNRWSHDEIDTFIEEYDKLQYYHKNGYIQTADCIGNYINIFQGERMTLDNPASYRHTMWLFGPCLFWGQYVDDAYSLGSLLRKKVDKTWYIRNVISNWRARNAVIRDSNIHSGDIVVIYAYDAAVFLGAGLEVYSLAEAYQQCPNLMQHVLDGPNHINWYMTKRIAVRLYQILEENHVFTTSGTLEQEDTEIVHFGIKKTMVRVPEPLSEWLRSVKKYRNLTSERTGAIVMNCNPFTLGHRYLIETACRQVDRLIVFVVEEDKSFFQFEDRIRMVQIGTEDLDHVIAIPSGKYIISAQTLPGYFEKDKNPDVVFDAASDLDIFAEVIAKELNIQVRFAGEEPIDRFTRQYNQAMKRILPEHGVEFIEIPRKKWDGEVISASRVRKLMKEKEFEKIRELVLPQVYEYLAEHYFGVTNYGI